jgi:phosphohistidine phosphatase
MIVIIMRHGEAVEYKAPDHTRALTDYGQRQSGIVGKWLNQNLPLLSTDGCGAGTGISETSVALNDKGECSSLKTTIDLALVSPYLRTQQTFVALAKHVNVLNQKTIESITPDGNAALNADLIHAYACDKNAPRYLLIITHMPLVSFLSDMVCSDFNGLFFKSADTLVVDYSGDTGIGKKLTMFQGME